VWNDPASVPPSYRFSYGNIADEATNAYSHFGDTTNLDAVYFVFTGPNHLPNGWDSSSCAFHYYQSGNGALFAYAYVPYPTSQPSGCAGYRNRVNSNDSYGHGLFDDYSILSGHEYAEAITNPTCQAWYNASLWNSLFCTETEIGDMCQGGAYNNVWVGGQYFAVQGIWSQATSSCPLLAAPSQCTYRSNTQFLVLATTTFSQNIYQGTERLTFYLERIVDPNYNWCFQTHLIMSWANGNLPPPLGSFDLNVRDSCNHSIQGSGWLHEHSSTSSEAYINTGWHIAYGPCNIVWGADDADGQNGSQVVDQFGYTINYWQPYWRATYVTYGTF
jgi:hypothetical protein